MGIRNHAHVLLEVDVWRNDVAWRSLTELLAGSPEEFGIVGAGSGEIGTGFVDHVHFKSFGVGLFGARDIHVHAIPFAVPVGIKFGFHPEEMADPF
jgi:hypothetical protein